MDRDNVQALIVGLSIALVLATIIFGISYGVNHRSDYQTCMAKCDYNLNGDLYELRCMEGCLSILNVTQQCNDTTVLKIEYSNEELR